MTPIDFTYQRFGRYISTISKTAWLSANGVAIDPAKNGARFGASGFAVLITEDRCSIVTGGFVPDFIEAADHITIQKSKSSSLDGLGQEIPAYPHQSIDYFVMSAQFDPPKGRFSVLDMSGKRLIKAGQVTLNHDAWLVSVTSAKAGVDTVNLRHVRQAFNEMGIDPLDVNKKTIAALRQNVALIEKAKMLKTDGLSSKEAAAYHAIKGSPFARHYSLLTRTQSIDGFFKYLDFLSKKNELGCV